MTRERIVTVRLTEEEHARWSAHAASSSRTLANWIRWRCEPGSLVIPALTAGDQPGLETAAGGATDAGPLAVPKTVAERDGSDSPAPAVSERQVKPFSKEQQTGRRT